LNKVVRERALLYGRARNRKREKGIDRRRDPASACAFGPLEPRPATGNRWDRRTRPGVWV